MTYETQPGTLPHRVVAHIKTLPVDAEISAPELAAALNVDVASIVPTLLAPCKHGALLRRKKMARHSARQVWWYSLGDGTPEPPDADFEQDKPLPTRAPAPAPAAAPTAWMAPIKVKEAPAPAPAPKVAALRGFDAWLSVSGAVVLQGLRLDEEGDAMLMPDDVHKLRRLLGALVA